MSSLTTSLAPTSMRYLILLSLIFTIKGASSFSSTTRLFNFLSASLINLFNYLLRPLALIRHSYSGKVLFMPPITKFKSQFCFNKFKNSYYTSLHHTLSSPL